MAFVTLFRNLAGVVHGAWDNELDLLSAVRQLYSFLPLNNHQPPPSIQCMDPEDRVSPMLDHFIPESNEVGRFEYVLGCYVIRCTHVRKAHLLGCSNACSDAHRLASAADFCCACTG